jgi:HEAT repeat protein
MCVLVLPAGSAGQTPGAREARLIEILKSGASIQEKDGACRELQVIATPASIPALAALLADKELSHMARYALEPMPYPQAGQALLEALGRVGPPIQVGIINSLGFREEKAAAPELIRLLKSPDAEIAGAAAAALGRIATPDAVAALEQLRATAAPPLQAAAAEASLALAERLMRDNRPAAVSIYEELQTPRWPLHVRQGAFAGIVSA